MRYTGGCCTDKGYHRDNNEDAILFRTVEKGDCVLAVGAICDGIGGVEGGEIASQYIIGQIENWFDTLVGWFDPEKCEPPVLFSHLQDGAERWNAELIPHMRNAGVQSGTTMSVIMAVNERVCILHVGDSRIYRYSARNGLGQLTTDATFSKMSGGRMRSFLDNYMGKSEELWFQTLEFRAEPGDLFIYCSDGGYHTLTETDAQEYRHRLSLGEEPNGVCALAVYNALQRGERDNTSIGMMFASEKEKKRGFSLFGSRKNRN